MRGVDALTKEFLAESLEGLDRMDRCLTDLEQRPHDKGLLGEIFRAVHTIKGTTGFLGYKRLEKLAHAGESLLGGLRDGRITANAEVVGGLLQLMDGLRRIVQRIDTTGRETGETNDDDGELIAVIEALNRPGDEEGDEADAEEEARLRQLRAAAAAGEGRGGASAGVAPAGAASASIAGASDRTLRIDVEVLNRMMNLVGELVLTRNQILQSHGESENFPALARRLDSVTAELRETVMQARMQPVAHLFGKFPRMVRDLALNCGKHVRMEYSGQQTGLDKSLLEAIKDPLTHAVRNAIDHGIEDPRVRALAGKHVEGVVQLRAYHHNGSVVIEVQDDGGGISTAKVLAKAVERGLVSEERAAEMPKREALQLIFEPGFSTAAKVTNISGRGVGMDVVLANVEKVGGTVEVESEEGKGTMLRMRVPLTLAIVRALVVRSGGQSFCLPQSSLAELVYVPRREAEQTVEWIGGAEVFRLRDKLLPMVRLDRMLGLLEQAQGTGAETHGFYLVVLDADGAHYGLVVDDLMSPEEIVVKPLSPVLREIGLFSGATVLGSGSLAMILDVVAVGERAGVRTAAVEQDATRKGEAAGMISPSSASFLIFEDRRQGGRAVRSALPLSNVVRIESIALTDVEYANGRPLLQYRGELLSLEDRAGMLDEDARRSVAQRGDETVTVLICQRPAGEEGSAGRKVGIVVRQVLEVASGDVLETDAAICTDVMARINARITVVHQPFAEMPLRSEVYA